MKKKLLTVISMAAVLMCLFAITAFAASQHYASFEVILEDNSRISAYTVGAPDLGNGKIKLSETAYTEPPVDSEGTYATLDWSKVKEIDFTNTKIYYYDSKKATYKEYTGGTNSDANGSVCVTKSWSNAATFASVKKVNTGNSWRFDPSLFKGWKGIETVIISNKVKTLSDDMFMDSTIANVIFEENAQVYRCNNNLFKNCDSLVSIDFPDSFTYLGNSGLFYDCDNLESVGWSINCPAIPGSAFNSCEKLKFEIPNYITEIKSSAFNGCKAITSVVIPSSVNAIGSDCFRNCSNLTSVVFGEGCSVSKMYAHTFDGCNLSEITLPNTVTQLRQNVFAGNPNLKVINLGASFTDCNLEGNNSASINCGNLEILYLSKNFTSASVRADIFKDDNSPSEWKKIHPNLVIFYEGDKTAAEAIVSAAQGNGTVINGVLAEITVVSLSEYEALKAQGTLSGRYLVYSYNPCKAFYGDKHQMKGEVTMKLDNYFDSILFVDQCTREGCGLAVEDKEKTIAPIFTYRGYSCTEEPINGVNSMTQSYSVNNEALAKYLVINPEFKFGLVASGYQNPLDESVDQNKVINYPSEKFAHQHFEIKVRGISGENMAKAIVFCLYVIDNGTYYLDNNTTTQNVSGISFNDLHAILYPKEII